MLFVHSWLLSNVVSIRFIYFIHSMLRSFYGFVGSFYLFFVSAIPLFLLMFNYRVLCVVLLLVFISLLVDFQ